VDSAGKNLYGTTNCDGEYGRGNVFQLTNMGGTWVYNSLHDFTGGSDGAFPESNVTIDANGNLYGTTSFGGDSTCNPGQGCGVIWTITP
jgi:uncharacterized repeat protein (TIGR03803 family)